MNFLRLNDYLLSVLFENEDIIAIDKPYGINSHTNDSKIGNSDFINDGLIETFERQLNRKLYIVHRLDQTTTGVIIFAKSPESAKIYADFFFHKQVQKTYWFITASRSDVDEIAIDQVIVHKAKDLQAQTLFKKIKNSSKFELWQANPLTGRNHQIRIHAQAAGIPLLGDQKYTGAEYPFLCLHNCRIEFPNGLVIQSNPPVYFNDLNLLENQILAKALFETDRRQRLFANVHGDQCFRLVHDKDLGFTIDQFGQHLILSSYEEQWTEQDQRTFSYYANYMQKPIYVRLMHDRGKDALNKSQFTIVPIGTTESLATNWVAKENNINYEMRSDSGQSFGLFLDQRLQRNWVKNNCKDKTVLNLFSYTCGFSVAAALGGAKEVTSVDTSKTVLNWGRKNFELNQIDVSKHKFLLRDSITYLEQSITKGLQFDLIICDPPSFSRGEKGVFKIETSLEVLLRTCLRCLSVDGDLLFSTNFENFFVDDIRQVILKVQADLNLQI